MPADPTRNTEGFRRVVRTLRTCRHPSRHRMAGPRIPLRWGSSPTEVCAFCKAWRTTLHTTGRWQRGPMPTDEVDDD